MADNYSSLILILILIVLIAPYAFQLTNKLKNNYVLNKRFKVELREREIEKLKQENVNNKINNLIQQYNIETLTSGGFVKLLYEYLDAKSDIERYYKDYNLSCADLANGVEYKSDSTFFNDIDFSRFTRDIAIENCQIANSTKGHYEQFIKEKGLIEKLISENQNNTDLEIRDFISNISRQLVSINLKLSLLD